MPLSHTHADFREDRENLVLQLHTQPRQDGSLLTRGGAQRLVDKCDAVYERHPRKYEIFWDADDIRYIESAGKLVTEKRREALDPSGKGYVMLPPSIMAQFGISLCQPDEDKGMSNAERLQMYGMAHLPVS